ncbi:MAG: hypothetical protein D6714_21325 [Bacteroidetes bacterium]|nr:MAG: hypothetical protein D6714_21325 [Bacteroidota bacterium]
MNRKKHLIYLMGVLCFLWAPNPFLLSQTTLRYVGSSTVGNFIRDADPFYEPLNFELNTEPESAGGERAILDGQADLAGVANIPCVEALSKGVVSSLIGWDAIGVLVHADLPVKNLTIEQLRDIFSGKITNWKTLGGPDLPVRPFITGIESATHKVFRSLVLGEAAYQNCTEVSPDVDILEKIRTTPGAIGQLSYSFMGDEVSGVRLVSVNGQELSLTNTNYPLTRPLYLLWWPGRRDIAEFVEWVLSPEGQRLVMKRFIGVREGLFLQDAGTGSLVVYTNTFAVEDGGTFFYPHRPYEILSPEHELIMRVSNHLSPNDETPTRVKLPVGSYLIRPESNDPAGQLFFVSIESGKLTRLDVRSHKNGAEPASQPSTEHKEPGQIFYPVGDLRLRGETDFRGDYRRFRGRFRGRAGVNVLLSPALKLNMRLTTTTNPDDPNSPYANFTSGFNQVSIVLDQAALTWQAARPLRFLLGKFSLPFEASGIYSELVWDADVQVEGAAFSLDYANLGPMKKMKWTSGAFLMSSFQSGNTGFWLHAHQGYFEWAFRPDQTLALGSGFLFFQNIKNADVSALTFDANAGNAVYEKLNIAGGDTLFSRHFESDFWLHDNFISWQYAGLPRPLRVKAQWVGNFGATHDRDGYALGLSYGRLNEKGEWRIYYQFQNMGQESVFSPFVQDDFLAQTGYRAHVAGIAYALNAKTSLHLWGLFSKNTLHPEPRATRIRLDLNLKI